MLPSPSAYPQYNFYHLSYQRIEYLYLGAETPYHTQEEGGHNVTIDYVKEFIYSLANLHVAVDGADGYVGTLSSSWGVLINVLQRTRGDGGFDFLSADEGSSFSSCF